MKRPRRKSPPSSPQLVQRSPVREGRPFPLGATWDGLGVNFALFSANATKVELCLFDIDGRQELERLELPEYTDEVWHGRRARDRERVQAVNVSAHIPLVVRDAADALARRRGMSLSSLIRDAVVAYTSAHAQAEALPSPTPVDA